MIVERYENGVRKKKSITNKSSWLLYEVSYDEQGQRHGLEHSAVGMNFIYEHGTPIKMISRIGEEPFNSDKHSRYLHADDDESCPYHALGIEFMRMVKN